jgi:DnaJ-class molecular chaperone
MQSPEPILRLARELGKKLPVDGYALNDYLSPGTSEQRPRELKSAGMYSRRAMEHASRKEFALGVADLVRALLRPNLDSTAQDRLMSGLSSVLQDSEKSIAESAKDGDLTELFEDLGIEDSISDNKDVDMKVLKKVYREMSIKYHPDKNEAAAARFNKIRDAYEILSDPMKTMLYDTGGMESVRKYEGGGGDLERTESEDKQFWVTLEDVYLGARSKMSHKRRVVCRSCRLHPELPRCKQCKPCPPKKEMRMNWINQHQYMQEEVDIPSKEKCVWVTDELDVAIDRGMNVGERVSFPHFANQEPQKITGDFQVSVWIKDHSLFKRVGNDLVVTVQVSLFEALMGFQRELKHLDGHIVKFGMDRGSVLQPGKGLVIDDEGMPLKEDPTSSGKLRVRFQIEFPETIPLSAADALETALRSTGLGEKQKTVTRSVKPRKNEL